MKTIVTAFLFSVILFGAARAAEPLAVEVSVTAVELDAAKKPFIVEVEVNIANRSQSKVDACDLVVDFLDAAGKAVMTRKHTLAALGLEPGAETLASFQDLDPPSSWARTVNIAARCR